MPSYHCLRGINPILKRVRAAGSNPSSPDDFLSASVPFRNGQFSFIVMATDTAAKISLWVILETNAKTIIVPELSYHEGFKTYEIKISSNDISLIEQELALKFQKKGTPYSFSAIMAELNVVLLQTTFTPSRRDLHRNQGILQSTPDISKQFVDDPAKIYLQGVMAPHGKPRAKTINKLFLVAEYAATYDGKMAIVEDLKQRNLTLVWTADRDKRVTFAQALIRWQKGQP